MGFYRYLNVLPSLETALDVSAMPLFWPGKLKARVFRLTTRRANVVQMLIVFVPLGLTLHG